MQEPFDERQKGTNPEVDSVQHSHAKVRRAERQQRAVWAILP